MPCRLSPKATQYVDLSNKERVELRLLSPAIIEYTSCSQKCNSAFEPDTLYLASRADGVEDKMFWIFVPHTVKMGNVQASLASPQKLVIERTGAKEDYAAEFCLTRYRGYEGVDFSIPRLVSVRVFQSDMGEIAARRPGTIHP